MLKIIDLRKKKNFSIIHFSSKKSNQDVERSVAAILRSVQTHGDSALIRLTKKYDGVVVPSPVVMQRDIVAALNKTDKKFIATLRHAAANIRRYHKKQIRHNWKIRDRFGSELRQIVTPLDSVGVYVPGGTAAYPSSVLMNVIPAQVAGVREIHLVSPPNNDGSINSDVLAAAAILGVKNIYRVGGAQAIAALTYGTDTIPAVDKIVGPGNIFVATAKRMVFGTVGIDSFAGPSEVAILADNSADPTFVAADLLAQAEHDPRSVPILVTPSAAFADKVDAEIERLLSLQTRKHIIAQSLRTAGCIYLVASIQQGIAVINRLAPEHLQIITTRDEEILKHIRHAGSIFLGNYTPVALGDYFAGPNHVLPTERTARFSSPLSVDDFVKRSSVVRYSQKRMESVAEEVAAFADREGLTGHALSLRSRVKATL